MYFRTPRLLTSHLARKYSTAIKELISKSPNNVSVLYGTHSGNTQKYAQDLRRELDGRFKLNATIASLSDVDFNGIEELNPSDILLVLVSTYGEGEPNDATKPFWMHLRQLNSDSKRLNFSYSVLSRGSSLFDDTFAYAGKALDSQLASLGAHRLTSVGIQDKISGRNDDEYFLWKESLFQKLKDQFQLEEVPYRYKPSIEVTEVEPSSGEIEPLTPYHRLSSDADLRFVSASVLQRSERKYIYAEVELPGYTTGDYIVLWPSNEDSVIDEFLTAVFGNSKRRDNLLQLNDGVYTSYHLLAKNYIDINGQPDHASLLKLADLAPSKEAGQRIKDIALTCDTELPGLAKIMRLASPSSPWIETLPPSAFFDLLPKLEPRRYSISSSSLESPNWAGISCVLEESVKDGFLGVATGNLLRINGKPNMQIMAANESVPNFRLPSSTKVPLLLFGVGTGVAPFRGFVRERYVQSRSEENVGPVVLFTGTRTANDLIHHDELKDFETKFDFKLITAYSRVDVSDGNRGYIADNIPKNEELIWNLFQQGAHIYICGDIKKVRYTVRRKLMEIIVPRMGLPPTDRKRVWKKLIAEGRIHLELW